MMVGGALLSVFGLAALAATFVAQKLEDHYNRQNRA